MKIQINQQELKKEWVINKWYEKVIYVIGFVYAFIFALAFVIGVIDGIIN